jgi:hypothetical protein
MRRKVGFFLSSAILTVTLVGSVLPGTCVGRDEPRRLRKERRPRQR